MSQGPSAMVADRAFDFAAGQALGVFRLLSFGMTSLFYLVEPGQPGTWAAKGLVVLCFTAAMLLAHRLVGRPDLSRAPLTPVAMVEAFGLPLLLLPTGGLASPFVWYALNPLFTAAVYLPAQYLWIITGGFLAAATVTTALSPLTRSGTMALSRDVALVILLVAIGAAVLGRLLRRVEQQAARIEEQRAELANAHRILSEKQADLAALADYQRQAIACADCAPLYDLLVSHLTGPLGLEWAAVVTCGAAERHEVISQNAPEAIDWAEAWRVADTVPLVGTAALGSVVAMRALVVVDGRLVAVACLPVGAAHHDDALRVLLEYTSQLAARLHEAQRTLVTLERLSGIYRLVERAGAYRSEEELLNLLVDAVRALSGADAAAFVPSVESVAELPEVASGPIGPQDVAWLAESGYGSRVPYSGHDEARSLYIRATPVERKGGNPSGALVVVRRQPFPPEVDADRTVAFLANLTSALVERLQAQRLHDRLVIAREQARIAAEIHDSVSQSLFSLVFGLDATLGCLPDDNPTLRESLASLRDVARNVSGEIRTAIQQLRQAVSDRSLAGEIEQRLAEQGRLYGFAPISVVTGAEDALTPSLRRAIQRIAQEAASNAARHGQANAVTVRLAVGATTTLEISDNGRGFTPPRVESIRDPGPRATAGTGLANMARLAESLGGSMRICSAPGEGCRIMVRFPAQHEGGVDISATGAAGR